MLGKVHSECALLVEIQNTKQVDTKRDSRGSRIALFFVKYFALQEGIGFGHVLVYFVAVAFSIASFVFMNVGQAYVLTDIFGVDRDKGAVSGTLVFADELLAVLLVSVWGFTSDIIGRRALYSLGFIFMAVGLVVYPHATEIFPTSFGSFFTSLLFFRLVFSLGASIVASLMAAFLSDTASESSRGRFAGMVGLCSGLGAVMGSLLFPNIPFWFEKKNQDVHLHLLPHYIMGVCLTLVSFSVLCFMSASKPLTLAAMPSRSIRPILCQVKVAIKSGKNPMILLAYLSSFVARAVTMTNTVFISLWVVSVYRHKGLCSPIQADMAVPLCASGEKRAHMIQGVLNTVSLVTAPFYGIMASRVSGRVATALAALFCVLGYGLLVLFPDPESPWQFFIACLSGIGQIGLIVAGLALVSAFSPPNVRGTISGTYSFFGALGILANSHLSGYLFDAWTPVAPFVVTLSWTSMLLCATVVLSLCELYFFSPHDTSSISSHLLDTQQA